MKVEESELKSDQFWGLVFDAFEKNPGWRVVKKWFEGKFVRGKEGEMWCLAFCGTPAMEVDF